MKKNLTSRLARLPAFPPTALKLLTVSTESETALEVFESCFKSDPAFAYELLLTANSVEFGLPAEVESIRHALALLGLERVSSLSFTIAMAFYMRNTPRRQVIHPVWSHSLACGLIAETLGRTMGTGLRNLYTAGLIHDIGRLGLLMTEGGPYAAVLTQVHENLEEATALERAKVGVTHAAAGAVMAKAWGIPEPICACIRSHHKASGREPILTELPDLVRLACRMAASLGYAELNCRRVEDLDAAMEGVPASVRNHPLLVPAALNARIKSLLASVW